MTKHIDIMVDIEALALYGPKPVITQLAFTAFDESYDPDEPGSALYSHEEYLPIQPQIDLNFTVQASTLIWWLTSPKVSEAARLKFIESEGEDMDELVSLVRSWIVKLDRMIPDNGTYQIWARGPQYDVVAIESLIRACGLTVPWKYDMVRDLRTVMSEAGLDREAIPFKTGLIPHHALSDCRHQMACLYEARRLLRAAS